MQTVSDFLQSSLEDSSSQSSVLSHLKSLGIKPKSRRDLVEETEEEGSDLKIYAFEEQITDSVCGEITQVCLLSFEGKKLTHYEFFVD